MLNKRCKQRRWDSQVIWRWWTNKYMKERHRFTHRERLRSRQWTPLSGIEPPRKTMSSDLRHSKKNKWYFSINKRLLNLKEWRLSYWQDSTKLRWLRGRHLKNWSRLWLVQACLKRTACRSFRKWTTKVEKWLLLYNRIDPMLDQKLVAQTLLEAIVQFWTLLLTQHLSLQVEFLSQWLFQVKIANLLS